jgi:hypothetical protein
VVARSSFVASMARKHKHMPTLVRLESIRQQRDDNKPPHIQNFPFDQLSFLSRLDRFFSWDSEISAVDSIRPVIAPETSSTAHRQNWIWDQQVFLQHKSSTNTLLPYSPRLNSRFNFPRDRHRTTIPTPKHHRIILTSGSGIAIL